MYLQAKNLGLFIITFWLSAFWYCNPVFTRYASRIALPYGKLQSVQAEISLILIKIISRWRNFILVKSISCLSDQIFLRNIYLRKTVLLSLTFSSFISHSIIFSIILKGLHRALGFLALYCITLELAMIIQNKSFHLFRYD